MKRIVTYLTGFSLLAITIISCSKEEQAQSRQQAETPQVMKADVPAGQTYVLNMDAGSTASIKTQAQHYQLSEIATPSNGNAVYKYTAAKGYAGTDEVTLQQAITSTSTSTSGSGGCSNNHNAANGSTTTAFKTIVIKFNVAN